MKVLRLACVFLGVLWLVIGASADEPEVWRIVVYNSPTRTLLSITPQGIEEIAKLPDSAQAVVLSPQENLVAINENPSTDYYERVTLYSLETGECCTEIASQEKFEPIFEEAWGGFTFEAKGFNADGTLLAVEYNYDAASPDAPYSDYRNGIAVIDVATREVIATAGEYDFAMWRGDQIAVCRPLTQPPGGGVIMPRYEEKTLTFWDFKTDVYTPTVYPVSLLEFTGSSDVGEFLSTGEYIASSFIAIDDVGGPGPEYIANALYVNGDNVSPVWFDHVPVYDFEDITPWDARARWVQDGAYLYNRVGAHRFRESAFGVALVSRTGEIITFETRDVFLVGTPQGWLALDRHGPEPMLIEYSVKNGEIERTPLFTFSLESIDVLKSPVLGDSLIDPAPFPEKSYAPPQG